MQAYYEAGQACSEETVSTVTCGACGKLLNTDMEAFHHLKSTCFRAFLKLPAKYKGGSWLSAARMLKPLKE